MQIECEINGREFRGLGKWDDEEGFTVDLKSFCDFKKDDLLPKLPKLLMVRYDMVRSAILIQPEIISFNPLQLITGSPLAHSIKIRAQAFLKGVPWDFQLNKKVKKFRLSTLAISLWRGDDNLKFNRKSQSSGSIDFKSTTRRRKIDLGILTIEQNVKSSLWPNLGKFKLQSTASSVLSYREPKNLLDCLHDIHVLEGYFDLLAAFPKRTANIEIYMEGYDQKFHLKIRCVQNENRLEPDQYQSFFKFNIFDANARTFNKYYSAYERINLLQSHLRYLSQNSLSFPESFLVACNIVESLGEDAPRADTDLIKKLNQIELALDKAKVEKKLFKTIVKQRLPLSASFRDRLIYMKLFFETYGVAFKIPLDEVVKTRSRYRHKILELNNDDITVMMRFIGAAWIYGLLWICREIGVPNKTILQAVQSESFHRFRRTNFRYWGDIIEK